jgi:hypothetical protein
LLNGLANSLMLIQIKVGIDRDGDYSQSAVPFQVNGQGLQISYLPVFDP